MKESVFFFPMVDEARPFCRRPASRASRPWANRPGPRVSFPRPHVRAARSYPLYIFRRRFRGGRVFFSFFSSPSLCQWVSTVTVAFESRPSWSASPSPRTPSASRRSRRRTSSILPRAGLLVARLDGRGARRDPSPVSTAASGVASRPHDSAAAVSRSASVAARSSLLCSSLAVTNCGPSLGMNTKSAPVRPRVRLERGPRVAHGSSTAPDRPRAGAASYARSIASGNTAELLDADALDRGGGAVGARQRGVEGVLDPLRSLDRALAILAKAFRVLDEGRGPELRG